MTKLMHSAGPPTASTAAEKEHMHSVYRQGGKERRMAPHVVYHESGCPYGCGQKLQAVDFCLELYGPDVHDPLVQAWWNDTGFAGRCPSCGGWVHFTIHGKRAITADEASCLPQLPDNWSGNALIL